MLIDIPPDLAEERDDLIHELVSTIMPVADAFDIFCS
jgi:hypothetical protein